MTTNIPKLMQRLTQQAKNATDLHARQHRTDEVTVRVLAADLYALVDHSRRSDTTLAKVEVLRRECHQLGRQWALGAGTAYHKCAEHLGMILNA